MAADLTQLCSCHPTACPTVSAMAAPRPPRFSGADRGVARGLVLDLGIEFGAEQHHDRREPHPHHQADAGAERAVGRVVIGEVRQVPGEQRRAGEPGEAAAQLPGSAIAMARRGAARPVAVEHGKSQKNHDDQSRPAQHSHQQRR